MSFAGTLELARRGELYPALILHGGDDQGRRDNALELARTLLCAAAPEERPCGVCNHCRRLQWPGTDDEIFHPDFHVLERDLKTSTSVEAVRKLLQVAQVSPFEARGQVFVVASAESLTGEAANALLKALEEPHVTAPRHFQLLAPSQFDLLPTLRSRSLSVFLGASTEVDAEAAAATAEDFARCILEYAKNGAGIYLLAAAGVLGSAADFKDPRSGRPWAVAARAVLASLEVEGMPVAARRRLLALAEALLGGAAFRLRGIPADRILEGLLARHLAAKGWDGPQPQR